MNPLTKQIAKKSNILKRCFATQKLPDDVSRSLLEDPRQLHKVSTDQGFDILKSQNVLDSYLMGILQASNVVYDVCKETDLQYAPILSQLLQNEIYLKREDQQPVFSFKLRGAYNKIASLTDEQKKKGIVACSAGNHAQGVALSAKRLNLDNIIVMPLATPSIKVDAARKFGGNVLLHGNNYDEAQAEALRLMKEEGRTLVHPFDDPKVIMGQGTIGMEILKQTGGKQIDAIFCCVGGGGLLAGISAYCKRVTPKTRMIGVEAKDSAAMTISLEENKTVTLDAVGLFADGAAVRTPGTNTFRIINEICDGMVTVSTDDICAAIKQGFEETRSVFEPAGALSIAGIVKYIRHTGVKGKTFVGITSGANMDFDRLRFVSERADYSESLLSVEIPEKPGAFFDLYNLIYPRNVTEFSYRLNPLNPKAHIFLSFQAPNTKEKEDVLEILKLNNFKADLLDDELVKVHLRHMVGGRASGIENERLIRFEFPERPGSLKHFLETLYTANQKLQEPWNVSLFHYRNHGADVGRVLAGLQVLKKDESKFKDFLESLDFQYVDETDNESYANFLL